MFRFVLGRGAVRCCPTSVHPLTEALLVFERLVSRQVVLDQLVLEQQLHRRQSVTAVTMSVCEGHTLRKTPGESWEVLNTGRTGTVHPEDGAPSPGSQLHTHGPRAPPTRLQQSVELTAQPHP